MRKKKNLVIVEASGKIAMLDQAFRRMGFDAEVLATVGHVAENQKTLANIGLDCDLRETNYAFRANRLSLLEKIAQAAHLADRVFLAMDDDQEGDVIAYDMAWVLSDCADKLCRVRLRAISDTELRASFNAPLSRDFEKQAGSGICRRIVDRAVGAAFSTIDEGELIAVGRIQSSLLLNLEEDHPIVGHFVIKSNVGPDVAHAKLDVKSRENLQTFEYFSTLLSNRDVRDFKVVNDISVESALSVPWGYAEIVDATSAKLKLPIKDISSALQDCYEKGRISYPRAGNNGYTPDAVEVAIALARQNRALFDAGLILLRSQTSHAHESPRLIDDSLTLGQSFSMLDTSEALAVLIARNMIECGQVQKKRELTLLVDGAELNFIVTKPIGMRPWKRPEMKVGYNEMARDRVMLSYMVKRDLGRASTLVHHVNRFLSRDLIVSRDGIGLELSVKGERWAQRAREVGFTKDTSTQMEQLFSGVSDAPHQAAKEVLAAHGMLDQVLAKVFNKNSIFNDQNLEMQ